MRMSQTTGCSCYRLSMSTMDRMMVAHLVGQLVETRADAVVEQRRNDGVRLLFDGLIKGGFTIAPIFVQIGFLNKILNIGLSQLLRKMCSEECSGNLNKKVFRSFHNCSENF